MACSWSYENKYLINTPNNTVQISRIGPELLTSAFHQTYV